MITDATRAVNLDPGDYDLAVKEMEEAGVDVIESDQVLNYT